MKILSTLAFMAIVTQCTLATSERKLLRSGYDSPVNFSDLAGLTNVNTEKHKSPKGGILPSTDSLPTSGHGTDILPTDLTTVAGGRSGLQSLTDSSRLGSVTNGVAKGGKLPSLPTSDTGDVTQGVSGITDSVSGLSDGLVLPSTSASGGKQTYQPGVQSEDRSLKSPKKGLRTPQPKKTSKKKTTAKNSHKPNVKPTPKPDPEQSPFQHSVE